jgi:hypothetical protein
VSKPTHVCRTLFDGTYGHVRAKCGGCHNCREALDCVYDTLYICRVCGGAEGSLLPFCPGRKLTYDEDQTNYKHYCDGTGPFARATLETISWAYQACYEYYFGDVGSMPPNREGARLLFYAVCKLQIDEPA